PPVRRSAARGIAADLSDAFLFEEKKVQVCTASCTNDARLAVFKPDATVRPRRFFAAMEVAQCKTSLKLGNLVRTSAECARNGLKQWSALNHTRHLWRIM